MLALQTNRSWPDDPNLSRRGSQSPSNSKKCGGSRSPCIFVSVEKMLLLGQRFLVGAPVKAWPLWALHRIEFFNHVFWLLLTRTWHFEGFSVCQKALAFTCVQCLLFSMLFNQSLLVVWHVICCARLIPLSTHGCCAPIQQNTEGGGTVGDTSCGVSCIVTSNLLFSHTDLYELQDRMLYPCYFFCIVFIFQLEGLSVHGQMTSLTKDYWPRHRSLHVGNVSGMHSYVVAFVCVGKHWSVGLINCIYMVRWGKVTNCFWFHTDSSLSVLEFSN